MWNMCHDSDCSNGNTGQHRSNVLVLKLMCNIAYKAYAYTVFNVYNAYIAYNAYNANYVHCRPIAHHEVEKKQSALRYVRIETAIALLCSFLINLFIVSVFAKVCVIFYCGALLHSLSFACVCLSVCWSVGQSVCVCLSTPVSVASSSNFQLSVKSVRTGNVHDMCRGSMGEIYLKTLVYSMQGSTWQAILAPAISTFGA